MATNLRNIEGNNVQEFVCVKTFEKLAKSCDAKMNEQQKQPNEIVFSDADQSVKFFLQKRKIFGKVTCQLPSVSKPRLAIKTQLNTLTAILPKTTIYKVTKQRVINVKLRDDYDDCNIMGSCIIDGDFLLLTDHEAKKLKRLNLSTETVTDYLSLISSPNTVCQVSKTEAAVSLHNHTVQFVTLGAKTGATRSLASNYYCWCLAYSNGKLFITDFYNSVYVHDINGRELRKITTDETGKAIFQDTRNIAVSADGSRVFVADENKGLITLDIQGNYMSSLSASDIQSLGCWGVCTDGGNVFVCGNWSGNVVQIGKGHKLLGQIGTIESPSSVCFDSVKRRLYVTQEGKNIVSVLELV